MPSVGMLRRVRFGAILGESLTEICEKIPRPQNFAFEIAPKSAAPHVLQLGNNPQGFPNTVPSVGVLRRVRFGAVRGEFREPKCSKNFRGRTIFRSKSREIRCGPRATALSPS